MTEYSNTWAFVDHSYSTHWGDLPLQATETRELFEVQPGIIFISEHLERVVYFSPLWKHLRKKRLFKLFMSFPKYFCADGMSLSLDALKRNLMNAAS